MHLIEAEEQRREQGQPRRARVWCQTLTQAVVGLAMWDWDPLWPSTCVVDVYCHPEFWKEGWSLLGALPLPVAERHVAYSDEGCPQKGEALRLAGFRQTVRHSERVAVDRARTRLVDVSVWEKS